MDTAKPRAITKSIAPATAHFDTGVCKYGIKTDAEIAGKFPKHKQGRVKNQRDAVCALLELARQNILEICHEIEGDLEIMHSTNMAESRRVNRLLENVQLKRIRSPFEHARILAGWGVTKESAKQDRESMLNFAIKNYGRMRLINEVTGGNKKADAYHIWAAECAGTQFFVTVDEKLVNICRHQRKCEFRTRIVYPTDLLSELKKA